MKHKYLLLAFLFALVACGNANGSKPSVDTLPPPPPDDSLSRDIGMMLLVGFRGTDIDTADNSDIVSALRDYHVGSVILFDYDCPSGRRGRNIQDPIQIQRLCSQLRQLNPSLLIGIDQEGGKVSRLATRYGFPAIPSAEYCAGKGDDTITLYAQLTAQTLSLLGINLNFAPVADVNVNPACPVIGKIQRSFSADPDRVAHCCSLWIDAQNAFGVVSCLKHFPGHGSAKGDTHLGLVDVTATWKSLELKPYRALSQKAPMIMTAHVVNRQLDPSGLPASLSPAITSYLRDTLAYDGVIVTDDLAMGAIIKEYSFETAVRMAVIAGADLLCLSNNGTSGYDPLMTSRAAYVIRQMVTSGEISADRIRRSADRVRSLSLQAIR